MRIFGINLEKLIAEAVDEITPVSAERQRQELQSDKLKPFRAKNSGKSKDSDDDDEVDEAEDENEEGSTAEKKKKHKGADSGPAEVENIPEVTAGKLVKILNTMRSGKSLSNKEVRVDFQKYFNTLSGDDRVAFYTFLDSVNKIVTDPEEKTAEDEELVSPDDIGVDIQSKPKKEKSEKSKDSGSGPIVVGEQADKSRIRRLLRRNR